jgi:hypothetical protein
MQRVISPKKTETISLPSPKAACALHVLAYTPSRLLQQMTVTIQIGGSPVNGGGPLPLDAFPPKGFPVGIGQNIDVTAHNPGPEEMTVNVSLGLAITAVP